MLPVVSLYDFTGDAVRPWAEAGYPCYCFDLQHAKGKPRVERVGKGNITYIYWNADTRNPVAQVLKHVQRACFVAGFPPCDDLAGCGAKHWPTKRDKDPEFQEKAVRRVRIVEVVGLQLRAKYVIENPSGAIPRLWRKWNFTFHPNEYGGYIPVSQAKHPKWPEFIPARDKYKKLTCLWVGGGFAMPLPKALKPEIIQSKNVARVRGSRQFFKLGGKSLKTKNIRSSSPRGFFAAVYLANK